MEKRTLRSATRAAAAQEQSAEHHHNTGATPPSAAASSSSPGAADRFKPLYKPNPISKNAKDNVTKRVNEDAQLRKQRRDELVSAKRFKRSSTKGSGASLAAAEAVAAADDGASLTDEGKRNTPELALGWKEETVGSVMYAVAVF